MAAVRVRPASTGDMGIFDKFDGPKWREKETNKKPNQLFRERVCNRKLAKIEKVSILHQWSKAFDWNLLIVSVRWARSFPFRGRWASGNLFTTPILFISFSWAFNYRWIHLKCFWKLKQLTKCGTVNQKQPSDCTCTYCIYYTVYTLYIYISVMYTNVFISRWDLNHHHQPSEA